MMSDDETVENADNQMDRWWLISNNTTHYYGYGTRSQADAYSDILDKRDNCSTNLYAVSEADTEDTAELEAGRPDGFLLTEEIKNMRSNGSSAGTELKENSDE